MPASTLLPSRLPRLLQSLARSAPSSVVGALAFVAACLSHPVSAAEGAKPPVVIPEVRGNTTVTPFGNGYLTRASDGTTYQTSQFGNGWITRASDGKTFTTSNFGNGSITRGPNGQTVTTSPFGSGVISHASGGAPSNATTTTTAQFGSGTITRSNSGQSTTLSRFGSGFISRGQPPASSKDQGSLLILPPPR